MRIVINTQYRENYGAHDWDGTGVCPQYWKNKGGTDYVVEGVNLPLDSTIHERAQAIVDGLRSVIETRSEYCTEDIIDWEIVMETGVYLTPFEQDQMEFEGVVRSWSPRLTVSGVMMNRVYVGEAA